MKDLVFCRNLKRLREEAGMTQNELEVIAELPLGLVSQYETGTRAPGLANIKSLVTALHCPATELLFGAPQP